jgi:ketosteroid isomerase-like protein
MSSASSEAGQLASLNENYIRSVQESDAAWFERHLAPDFVNQNPDCTASDRAAFIAFMSKPCGVSGLRADDVRIQVLGEVAIIRARTVYTRPGGALAHGRYTDVWQWRDGRWLCVSADVTRG